MGLPRPAMSEEHAMHFLRSCICCVCCTCDQSLLWVEGVYFTLGRGHLIFLEIAFFFFSFQQRSNIQFLNSCRMELCLMASWWMWVFLLFCCLWQSLDTVVGVLFSDQGLISGFCFVCLFVTSFYCLPICYFLIFCSWDCGILSSSLLAYEVAQNGRSERDCCVLLWLRWVLPEEHKKMQTWWNITSVCVKHFLKHAKGGYRWLIASAVGKGAAPSYYWIPFY